MPDRPIEELNNTARVVLGMIAEGHSTGYAIKAEIERSTRLYWGASVGGIYPELRRLTEAGLVAVCDDPRGAMRRHSYTLTPAGHEALTAWLTDDCEPVLEMRSEPLLRLRFAGVLDPDQRLDVVRQMRVAYEARVREVSDRLAAGGFDDPFHRMTAEFGLAYSQWGRDWCADAERRLLAEGCLGQPAQTG
jgi:PadR family transcriptional regulator, regulatory protein AphA